MRCEAVRGYHKKRPSPVEALLAGGDTTMKRAHVLLRVFSVYWQLIERRDCINTIVNVFW